VCKFLIPFLLIIAFQTSLFAQDKKPDADVPDSIKILQKEKDVTTPVTPKEKAIEKKFRNKVYSIPQFGHETVLFIKQPTKWIGRDWLRLGMVVAATIAVMPFDERITNSTQGEQRFYKSVPIEAGRIYGEWYSIGGVAGAFGIYGLIANDTSAKKITVELLQAGLYSEIISAVILKVVVGRQRPIATENAFNFHPFSLTKEFQSMPSGHTTSAFALSTVMSRHAHSTGLKILAFVPAGFTMFSRIYQHHHWLSDEIPAAAIGYFVGNWVVDMHEGKRHRINVTSIYPVGISYAIK
jgi:hypothetical protein